MIDIEEPRGGGELMIKIGSFLFWEERTGEERIAAAVDGPNSRPRGNED